MTQTELHTLAVLADCYTPFLLLITLFEVWCSWFGGNKLHVAQLVYATFVVYLLMFIDNYFQLWAMAGLDYSTHSAAAFALITVIGLEKRFPYKVILAVSLAIYGCLMNLLNYHTWGDMLTTVLVIGISLFPVLRLSKTSLAKDSTS
jgi:chromate transport protein ChrA